MWTYTGLVVAVFLVLAVTIEFASQSRAMTPVDVTDALHDITLDALAAQTPDRPVVRPFSPRDLRAYRLRNGHFLVCGRALSDYPDQMTGFSVQFARKSGQLLPQRTYIDRKADRLCEGGRIPLMSFGRRVP